MIRQTSNRNCQLKSVTVDATFISQPADWLTIQAQTHHLGWLLAHADDGVIWGKIENGHLHLSGDIFETISPPLRATTLQQLWLFGPETELHLWRIETNHFLARLLTENDSSTPDCLEETYLLWGTPAETSKDGFTLLADGRQGLKHAVPLSVQADRKHSLSLTLRHYLAYDADGQAYIKLSRLVKINDGGQDA